MCVNIVKITQCADLQLGMVVVLHKTTTLF